MENLAQSIMIQNAEIDEPLNLEIITNVLEQEIERIVNYDIKMFSLEVFWWHLQHLIP